MDPLSAPRDARRTGAFSRQPLKGSGLAYGTFGGSTRGVGGGGLPGLLAGLLGALRGRRASAANPPMFMARAGRPNLVPAEFSAPKMAAPMAGGGPRVCLGGT